MKNGKSNFKFLNILNMANFEAFCWNFSSSTNSETGRSDYFQGIDALLKIIDSVDVKYMTLFLKIEIKS